MWLRILYELGLTNLSLEQVHEYEHSNASEQVHEHKHSNASEQVRKYEHFNTSEQVREYEHPNASEQVRKYEHSNASEQVRKYEHSNASEQVREYKHSFEDTHAFTSDLHYLLTTAKDAAKVLHHNAKYFEAQGKNPTAEHDAVRWLNLAILLVEQDLRVAPTVGLDEIKQQSATIKKRVKL